MNSASPRYQQDEQKPPCTPPSLQPRSEPTNPYPTTFVQADTSSFKQVVQMLTGSQQQPSSSSSSSSSSKPIPKSRKQQQHFKLYERRNSLLKNLHINPNTYSIRKPEILSPSILDFPSLVLSPVTPLIPDPFDRSTAAEEEDKAIKEKGFFLHPSPREGEPVLLPLFPTTSPRADAAAASGSSASILN